MQQPTPRPLPERSQNSPRREQIIAIAAGLIARRGYAATTVRDIADHAGILSGSLYHHVSSKEQILQELLRSFLASLIAELQHIEAHATDPLQQLDQLVTLVLETIEAQPDVATLYQQESAWLSTVEGFEFLADEAQRIEHIWTTALRTGQRDGTIRADLDPELTYRFIRDALWSTVRWFRPDEHDSAALATNLLRLLHTGLLTT